LPVWSKAHFITVVTLLNATLNAQSILEACQQFTDEMKLWMCSSISPSCFSRGYKQLCVYCLGPGVVAGCQLRKWRRNKKRCEESKYNNYCWRYSFNSWKL